MSWYDDNPKAWKQVIETVSRETGRSELMIEKDTIQSMFLCELSKTSLPFVFKGGTSLSKAFGLIDRFSEDIDISMSRKPTESEKRTVKKTIMSIADRLGLSIYNPDDIFSRHDYNKYVFEYESFFSEHRMEIIVETSFFQSVYPVQMKEIHSFIGEFCNRENISLPIAFTSDVFSMSVQTLERTFIDKVFAVCDYKIQNMQNRDSRHLYDIAKLVPYITVNDELRELVASVRNDRTKSRNNPSAQPEYNISEMLEDIISSKFYEPDYKDITQKLLYEDYSYEQAIDNGIAVVAKWGIF